MLTYIDTILVKKKKQDRSRLARLFEKLNFLKIRKISNILTINNSGNYRDCQMSLKNPTVLKKSALELSKLDCIYPRSQVGVYRYIGPLVYNIVILCPVKTVTLYHLQIDLMKETVERSIEVEEKKNGLVIVKALYGKLVADNQE